MARTHTKWTKILSVVLTVLMIVPMCITGMGLSASAAVPTFTTENLDNWNVIGGNYYNDVAGHDEANSLFNTNVNDQGKISFISPGTQIGAIGWNEGAKILAEAKGTAPLDGLGFRLDLSKLQVPTDKAAFSVGIVSDDITAIPDNNEDCLKGLAAVAANPNDVVVTFNQEVLSTENHINKISVYVGGELQIWQYIDWIVTSENNDMSVSFEAVPGGNSKTIYECSVFAATHSSRTGAGQGATIQSFQFEVNSRDGIVGHPAVFSGAFGEDSHYFPDFSVNKIVYNKCNAAGASTDIGAADFAGVYNVVLSYDESASAFSGLPALSTINGFTGSPIVLDSFGNFTKENPDGTITKFDGWYENGVKISTGGSYEFSCGTHSVAAKWRTGLQDYDIIYKDQGGAAFSGTLPADAPSYYTVEGIALPAASKTGYNFAGWYNNAECKGLPVTAILAGNTGTKTFYAKYTPHTYYIAFDAQDGTNAPAKATRVYGDATAVPVSLPTPPAGLQFAGWALTPGGNVVFDRSISSLEDALLYPGSNGGAVTVYAIYAVDPYYHIQLHVNIPEGSEEIYYNTVNPDVARRYYTVKTNISVGDAFRFEPANNGTDYCSIGASGWSSMKGWASTKEKADNGVTDIFTYTDNTAHDVVLDYEALDPDGDHQIDFYACWQRVVELDAGVGGNGQKSYIGLFVDGNNSLTDLIAGTDPNGAADEYENAAVLSRLNAKYNIAPSNPSAIFNGWKNGNTPVAPANLTKDWFDQNCRTRQNLVLSANWRVEGYTVTYYNGSSILGTQIVAAPVPGEPVDATLWGKAEFAAKCPGWALCGWTTNYANTWYTDGHTFGSQFFEPGQRVTLSGDLTIYGWATRTDLVLKYDANGGYWDHGAGSGSGADTNTAIHYNNSFFANITPYTGGGAGTPTSASWYRFPTETPSLGRAGYRLHTSLNHIEIPRFYTANGRGTGIKGELNNGYGFDCWPDAAYDSYLASYLGLNPGDTLTLYVAWDPIITYNMNYNGGAVVQDYNYITSNNMYTILGLGGYTMYSTSNSVEGRDADGRNALRQNREGYSGPVSIPSSRSGYSFRGWNTKPDGSGTSYSVGGSYNITTPLVLYAQWSKTDSNTVYIKYADQGGGNFSGENLAALPSVHNKNGTTNLVNATKRGYTFGGWYTNSACTGMPITRLTNANTSTTTLYAKWTPVTLTVTFKSDDGLTTLGTSQVTYGGNAAFNGLVPGKPRTEQYTYTFSKWVTAPGGTTEANLSGVLTNLTVYARYSKTVNTYTVKWSVNGKIINTETLKYGATPKYRYADPEVAGYTFKGWSPEFAQVTQDVTYTAILESDTPVTTVYTVTWVNYNLALLEQDKNVPEGTMPSYDGAVPTKPNDSKYRYEFAGWDKALVPVTGNIMYQAQFTRIALEPEPHTHTWGDWQIITEATATTDGLKRRYCNGCDEYEEEIIPATGVVNTYTVTWVNYNLALLEQDKNVPEGTMPSYDGAVPTKPNDSKYRYEFAGWDKALVPVTGNIMYQAQFTRIALEPEPHTHTWGNWQIITEATATTDGLRRRYCTGCDEYQEEIIPATGEIPTGDGRVSADNYLITFENAADISAIRIASGNLTTTAEIKDAPGCINISKAIITADIDADGNYSYEIPDGGIWSVWYKLTDGTQKIVSGINMTYMTQTVDTYGVTVTVNNLFGVKDFFIAKGHFTTYRDVKTAPGCLTVPGTKFAGAHSYKYGAAIGDPGEYTLYIRYEDSERADAVLYFNCEVETPMVDVFGKNITVGNIDDIRVIRVVPGTYSTSNAVKNAEGCRNFTSSTIAGLANADGSLTINNAVNENGSDTNYTVSVEYKNLYTEIHNVTLNKLMPKYTVKGNSITFTGLDGLDIIRYAPGTYTNAADIKNAPGAQYVKGANVTNGTVTLNGLSETYSFLVQYTENSKNVFTLNF